MPAGVVTLYHPTDTMIAGIRQYIFSLHPCYIIDNSIHKNKSSLAKIVSLPNVIYIDNKGNRGVAYALNQAVQRCKESGIEWLLLLDQDSIIKPKAIRSLYHVAMTYPKNNLGIVAANYKPQFRTNGIEEPLEVITSGSLLNVNICCQIGGFLNYLFIDEVDNEYCLRLALNHYHIIKLNDVLFQHTLGYKKYDKEIVTYNYSPVRYYYIIRNTLYVANKFKQQFPDLYMQKHACIKRWVKMVFYEKNTLTKLFFMLRGFIDYKRNKFGIYSGKRLK